MSSEFRRFREDPAPQKKSKKGLIIGLIIGGIVLAIIIIVVVIILVSRSRAAAKKSSLVPGVTCVTDSDCSKQCNTSSGLCVECTDDSLCSDTFPRCLDSLNKCVQCLATADCTSPEICSGNECCDQRAPIITAVVGEVLTGGKQQITITYDFFQQSNANLYIVFEDPFDGTPLGTSVCDAVPTVSCSTTPDCTDDDICIDGGCKTPGCISQPLNGTAILIDDQINFKIFPNTLYRVKIKSVYSCGAIINASTEYSNSPTFTTAPCNTTPVHTIITIAQSLGGFFITLAGPFTNFTAGVLINDTPGAHPNTAFLSPDLPGLYTGGPVGSITIIGLPDPGTYYIRTFQQGAISSCDGHLSNEVSFTVV